MPRLDMREPGVGFRRRRVGLQRRFSPGPGDSFGSITAGARERTYLLHVPPSYDGSRRLPLVIVLHGGTGNAPGTAVMTGMSETADREGFFAVYPNGTGLLSERILTWNVLFGFGYALRNGVDDTGFIRALVEELVRIHPIDERRIYATGISNGGMLAYLLGSTCSDIFAGIAPVAGAVAAKPNPRSEYVAFPSPARPVPVIAFHGKQDRLVPYTGGKGLGMANAVYAPVSHSIAAWVGWNGCAPTPDVITSPNGNVVSETYPAAEGVATVQLVTIENGGHAWPGGLRYPGGVEPPQDISANDMMWRFFMGTGRAVHFAR
jgi:polyhydroxybutyrate depolymerase